MYIRQLYHASGGASTVVCIPPRYLKVAKLKKGDAVKIELDKFNRITISKVIIHNPEEEETRTRR